MPEIGETHSGDWALVEIDGGEAWLPAEEALLLGVDVVDYRPEADGVWGGPGVGWMIDGEAVDPQCPPVVESP